MSETIQINETPLGTLPDMITEKVIRSEYDISSNDEWNHHSERYRVFFNNGFGVSFVRGTYSYGGSENLWEVGILEQTDGGGYGLTYDTPITDDVLGWQNDADVLAHLHSASLLSRERVEKYNEAQKIRHAYEEALAALNALQSVSGLDMEHVMRELDTAMMGPDDGE